MAGKYTLIADLLPPEQRVAGNTVLGLADQLSLMIGPALAGLVTAAAGPAVVIAADAASWVVLAVSYARIGPLADPTMSAANTCSDLRSNVSLVLIVSGMFTMPCAPDVLTPRCVLLQRERFNDRVRNRARTSADLMEGTAPSWPLCFFLPVLIEQILRWRLIRLLVLEGSVSFVRFTCHEPMVVATPSHR